MSMFVDKATITIVSGKGGNGAVSFRTEKYVPDGGPDGGDGGKGGNVVFVADKSLRTLMDFKYRQKYKAENGEDGMRKKKFGKDGEDLIVKIPCGTVLVDEESNKVMHDFANDGDKFVAALGGKGGKGNVHFKNSVRQAPNFAEAGGSPQQRSVVLELKLIADVGLIGFPNVGKSTLLSMSTKAKPKIANYHFTTLHPNLGVVNLANTEFVMADIPGIIEGAHEGTGLGHEFLKHVERTKLMIHVVDVSGFEGRDPKEDYIIINKELNEYSAKLATKPQLVACNKTDLIPDGIESYNNFKKYLDEQDIEYFEISAATGKGVTELLNKAANQLYILEQNEPEQEEDYEILEVKPIDEDEDYKDVNVEAEDDVFVLTGKQLKKIFDSTNFNDYGSLRYLYKYIEKSGAMDKMKKMGLQDGDIIRIFDYELEYYDEE